MMTLTEKIKTLYPELQNFDFASGVIVLENASDGNGDYIAQWNHPMLTRPTEQQLMEFDNA